MSRSCTVMKQPISSRLFNAYSPRRRAQDVGDSRFFVEPRTLHVCCGPMLADSWLLLVLTEAPELPS